MIRNLLKAALGITARDRRIADLTFQCQHGADLYHADAKHHAARVAEIQSELDRANAVGAEVPGLLEEIERANALAASRLAALHVERDAKNREVEALKAHRAALSAELHEATHPPRAFTMFGISHQAEERRKLIREAIEFLEAANPHAWQSNVKTAIQRLTGAL